MTEPRSFRDYFAIKKDNWPLLLGVILIITGLSLAFSWDPPIVFGSDLVGKILIAGITEIGFAFFIAHIIIASVDERHKVNFHEEVKKQKEDLESRLEEAERQLAVRGYLSHALGMDIPKVVSDSIAEYLTTSQLIKKEQKIRYEVAFAGNYVKLFQTLTVVYQNVGKQDCPFSPTFDSYDSRKKEIEDSLPDETWGIHQPTFQFREKPSEDWSELVLPVKIEGGRANLKKPFTIRPGQQVRMTISETVPKFQSDNEVFTNKQLAETLELEILYPKRSMKLDYRVVHPRVSPTTAMETGSGLLVQSNCPFLPGHGVVVWWDRVAR